MCKLNELLLPNTNYCGVIIKMNEGHIFYPYKVLKMANGCLMPTLNCALSPHKEKNDFYEFCERFKSAIENSTEVDPGVFIESISGTKEIIRDRILLLNKRHGLPGIIQARLQVTA